MKTSNILVFIGLIILLGLCIYFYRRMKKTEDILDASKKQNKNIIASKEMEFEETHNRIIEEQKNISASIINGKNKEIYDLFNQIETLRKHSTNPGEILTQKYLTEVKYKLIKQGYIKDEEMVIMANVFVPTWGKKGNRYLRQLDHLVILPTRIYVIETKYWQGNVFHGINKENANGLDFILESVYPDSPSTEKHTITFRKNEVINDNEKTTIMEVRKYKDPAKQVRGAAATLRDYLVSANIECGHVEPILHFAYEEKQPTDFTKVFTRKELSNINSQQTYTSTCKDDLLNIFKTELKQRKRQFEVADLKNIENIIRNYNHHLT